MNILNGDIIAIREENYHDNGVVVDVEYPTDGSADYYVLADFGGEGLGRIPVRRGLLPKHFYVIRQG
jgi:hypothetical protein